MQPFVKGPAYLPVVIHLPPKQPAMAAPAWPSSAARGGCSGYRTASWIGGIRSEPAATRCRSCRRHAWQQLGSQASFKFRQSCGCRRRSRQHRCPGRERGARWGRRGRRLCLRQRLCEAAGGVALTPFCQERDVCRCKRGKTPLVTRITCCDSDSWAPAQGRSPLR